LAADWPAWRSEAGCNRSEVWQSAERWSRLARWWRWGRWSPYLGLRERLARSWRGVGGWPVGRGAGKKGGRVKLYGFHSAHSCTSWSVMVWMNGGMCAFKTMAV